MLKNLFEKEKKHLLRVLKPLRSGVNSIKNEIKNLEEEYASGMKEIASFGTLDEKKEQIKILNNMMKSRNYNYKSDYLLKRYEKQLFSPYFAKITFVPNDTAKLQNYYIGKYAYFPDDESLRIIDWRAPVASIFYNFQDPTKRATYSFENREGKTQKIDGELLQRLNLEIASSSLLAVYDNSLRIDLLKSKISEKSGGKLSDIIETIQAEQNNIIRTSPDKVCIIQGTAGSGKTTIAVHRLSYLLYTYPSIKEDDILLLSSSKVLVNYTAKILPELEVLKIEKNTLDYFLIQTLVKNGVKLDTKLHKDGKDINTEIYNSLSFISAMSAYLNKKEKEFRSDFEGENFYEDLNLSVYFKSAKILDCTDYMYSRLLERYKDLKTELDNGNILVEKELLILEDALDYLKNFYKKYHPKLILEGFLYEYLHKKIKILDLNIDTLSAIFFAHNYFSTVDINGGKLFKQVIVDEAQDLGLLNFSVVKSLSQKTGFTILGDLNQALLAKGIIHSWEELEKVFEKENIEYFNIPISYRNTKQITEFARSVLLPFQDAKYLPQEFDREGGEVQIVHFQNELDTIMQIALEIKRKQKNGDLRAVAIVDCEGDKVLHYSSLLQKEGIKHFIVNEKFENFSESGVYLIPADMIKGLEFDSVYLINANIAPKDFLSAKKLFVLATRAINNLTIYSAS